MTRPAMLGSHYGRWRSGVLLLSIVSRGLLVGSGVQAEVGPATQAPEPSGVVVELFTSQGCSSCPPADALLARLAGEPGLAGRVVALAFHVDYWNSLGWRDPFSAAAWSRRQSDYAEVLGGGRIYTPQAVVSGRTACVGSDEDELRSHIATASRQPMGRIALRREGEYLAIAAAPPNGRRATAMIAIYEREHTTAVPSGENGGRDLHEAFVVRGLEPAFELPSADAGEHLVPLRLDPAWRGLRLGAAVFLQDPSTREIFGGKSIDL